MTTNTYVIPLPAVDERGTPLAKMPDCPHCGEDELSMLPMLGGAAFCNRCCAHVTRQEPGMSITEVLLRCGQCPWMGRLGATEPGDEGELLCPQCHNEISVKTPEPPR